MNRKAKLAAGIGAALAVAGGGAAIAASQSGSPREESQAVLDDAAKQLGIEPAKLSDALRTALANRVDAAVAAGRLTKEQGDRLKERIRSGELPLFAGPRGHGPGFGFGHHLGLDAAASYLGLTEAELRRELESGKTLAEVAEAKDKSVDGLVDALVAAAKERLAEAVGAGRLTQAQADQVLADLEQRVTERVNGKGPGGADFRRGRFGFAGPPPPLGTAA